MADEVGFDMAKVMLFVTFMQLVPHLRTACCQLRSNPLRVQVEDVIECLATLMELLVGLSTVPGFGTYHWGLVLKRNQ